MQVLKTSYLQVGVVVLCFSFDPLDLKYIQVLKRGYAELYSRVKPHMNIGTIGVFLLPLSQVLLHIMLQVTLIMEKQR